MNLYGRLMVNLSEDRNFALQSYAEEINDVINPPTNVSADDIYVRAIYLVSDQINSYGGRFPKNELSNLCHLIIDSPVLVGHNKSGLPIARNFKAEVIEKNDESWVKVWFYWLKKAEGSEALLANIDGGIYKEGSIGFIFSLPECGICGEDIRGCLHVPLKKYGSGEDEMVCHYNYRRIEKVLETSLVFRGANPNTRTTNDLIFSRGNGYGLRKVENSAVFLLKNGHHKFSVVFPQFNLASLENNRSLIGYVITQPDKLKDILHDDNNSSGWENGKAEIENSSDEGCILALDGESFSGRYSINPAFWNRRKLLLFSKLN